MGSPITFSGRSSVDVSQILIGLIAAERANMTSLDAQKAALCTQRAAYTTLAGKLRALESSLDSPTSSDGVSHMAAAENQLNAFVTAYNDVTSFLALQNTGAVNGAIDRDGIVCGLRAGLCEALEVEHLAAATPSRLSKVGIEFEQTGTIRLDATTLVVALNDSVASVLTLIDAAFGDVQATVNWYIRAGGPIQIVTDQLTRQISAIETRFESMQRQLDLRRAALQQEFNTADLLMSQLKGQGSSLQALNGQYRLF